MSFRLDIVEDKISELEDKSEKNIHYEAQRKIRKENVEHRGRT